MTASLTSQAAALTDELAAYDYALPDELIARATALQPLLRAQQEQNDARGAYSEELHRAFQRAGLYCRPMVVVDGERFKPAVLHLETALARLGDRPLPDCRNSIKVLTMGNMIRTSP